MEKSWTFLSDFCWLSLLLSTKSSCSSSSLHGVTSEPSPVQDGSRSSSSGEEWWLQPAVWHLGCRHHFYRAGRAAASDVWPSPHEVSLVTSSLFLQPSCCLVAHLTLCFPQSFVPDVKEQLPASKAKGQKQMVGEQNVKRAVLGETLPIGSLRTKLSPPAGPPASITLSKCPSPKTQRRGPQRKSFYQ